MQPPSTRAASSPSVTHSSEPPPPLLLLVGVGVIGGELTGAVTATWVLIDFEPPLPVQARVNVVPVWSAAVCSEPLSATDPLQPPDAVQELALVEDQVIIDVPFMVTVEGVALIVTVGALAVGGAVAEIVTPADLEMLPPVPEHCSVNVAFAVNDPTASLPVTAFVPVHAPEAVQLVALLLDQESCVLPPLCTVVGVALKLRVGAAGVGVPVTVT